MTIYEKVVKVIEEYLSELCDMDASEYFRQGEYRVVFNNRTASCDSMIGISIDFETCILTYRMFYNVKAVTEEQKTAIAEYLRRIDETMIHDRCKGSVEDNGAIYVKVDHRCILYGLTYEHLKMFERICTERIASDRFKIKRFIKG